ncbi:MAG: esterase-like activity of phytase family protein [Erythrobacter sp.]|nr:esterase-like activity of phytase family protein [Erythrobacter sp.]
MRPVRAFLAISVALALAPGTFWRSEVRPIDPGAAIVFTPADIAPEERRRGPLLLTGVWDLSSTNRGLGGYSALIARTDGSLLAGSDTGGLLVIERPGMQKMQARFADTSDNANRDKRDVDLEALTYDPASGRIWAAYEGSNAIEALGPDLSRTARVKPEMMQGWRSNSGPEAFTRLADGRFVVVAEVLRRGETYHRGVIFAGDPTGNAAAHEFRFAAPEGFRPVDMTQVPSGEVLVLLRRVEWGLPPRFVNAIARLDPARLAPDTVWRPEQVLDLPRGMPNDNFEGLTSVREADGSTVLWLVSDDNFSAFQRSLLVRMEWLGAPSPTDRTREKAPGNPERPSRNR